MPRDPFKVTKMSTTKSILANGHPTTQTPTKNKVNKRKREQRTTETTLAEHH